MISSVSRYAEFTTNYIEKAFETWFAAGRPANNRLLEILPKDEHGRLPGIAALNKWKIDYLWSIRADDLDSKAIAIAEDALVMQKAEMLKRQADNAFKIAAKALEFIIGDDFDSSASAVNAYFRATEEERMTKGISQMIVKMSKMQDSELAETVIDLLRRANDNDQIIDSAPIDTESKENIAPNSE